MYYMYYVLPVLQVQVFMSIGYIILFVDSCPAITLLDPDVSGFFLFFFFLFLFFFLVMFSC